MSLRSDPLEREVALPDGRTLVVRVGVPEDPYIPQRDLDTVVVELLEDGRGVAAVTTILDADETSEARRLLATIVEGLGSGALEPTAGAIEPLATSSEL